MMSGTPDHRYRATIHTDDPASRRRAPDTRSVSVPNIRVAPTARARLRATAAAWRRQSVSRACPAHPPGRPPVPTGRLFQRAAVAVLGLAALMSAAPVPSPVGHPLGFELRPRVAIQTPFRPAFVRKRSRRVGMLPDSRCIASMSESRLARRSWVTQEADFRCTCCPVTAEGYPPVRPAEIPTHTACVALHAAVQRCGPGHPHLHRPANTHLQRGTHYTVVNIATSGTPLYDATLSDSEDGGSATGWAIGNGYVWYNSAPQQDEVPANRRREFASGATVKTQQYK